MRNIKRLAIILGCAVLTASLCACGGGKPSEAQPAPSDSEAAVSGETTESVPAGEASEEDITDVTDFDDGDTDKNRNDRIKNL